MSICTSNAVHLQLCCNMPVCDSANSYIFVLHGHRVCRRFCRYQSSLAACMCILDSNVRVCTSNFVRLQLFCSMPACVLDNSCVFCMLTMFCAFCLYQSSRAACLYMCSGVFGLKYLETGLCAACTHFPFGMLIDMPENYLHFTIARLFPFVSSL